LKSRKWEGERGRRSEEKEGKREKEVEIV